MALTLLQKTPAASHPRGGYDEHHADFIQRFVQSESTKKERPKSLTASQSAALGRQLGEVQFLPPAYADQTKVNIAGILRKWERFCTFRGLKGTWLEEIKKVDKALAGEFLYFYIDKSNLGRRGASWEYFRQFKQLYACATGSYMNVNHTKEVKKFHDTVVAPLFGLLPPDSSNKPVIGDDGMYALLVFNIAFDIRIFPQERRRVNLHGVLLFLAYTGGRPAEFVKNVRKPPNDGSQEKIFGPQAIMERALQACDEDLDKDDEAEPSEDSGLLQNMLSRAVTSRGRPKALCYEDILLSIVRHPETGRDVPVMAVRLIHHKGADRKPKPTIFFFFTDTMLLFCPVTVIVGLAVRDRAFDAPSLTDARSVFEVKNWGPSQCTPIRWKEEWHKRPVFRRCYASHTSEDEPYPYYQFNEDVQSAGLGAGLEQGVGGRSVRRWTANELNGDAPDLVRDQIMRHDPRWAVFFSAYINNMVEWDVQRTVRGQPRDDKLIKMLSHVSLTRDPRASKRMVPEKVWADMPPDPQVVELENRRAQLKGGRYRLKGNPNEQEIRDIGIQIRNKRSRRGKNIEKQYRPYYFYNRPTWDIEMQARGQPEPTYIPPTVTLHIKERAQLAEMFCNQPNNLSEEELDQQRIQAADTISTLCEKRETPKRPRIRQRHAAEAPVKQESPEPDPFPLLMDKEQCPDCFGDEALTLEERTFRYCRPDVMNNHFEDEHLPERERTNQIVCKHPKCRRKTLKDLDHFRNHVCTVHQVSLRTAQQVQRRRVRKTQLRQIRNFMSHGRTVH